MAVRALVVGSLVMDLSFRVPKRPEPGEVILAESFGTYRGGKGYNQAVALARLGAEVTMIGAVADDHYGRDFLESLAQEGIDTSRMVVLEDSYTSVAVPIVTPDGDVGFVHAPGTNHGLTPDHCRDLPECDVLLVQGEVPIETTTFVEHEARSHGALVFLNPAPVHNVTDGMVTLADVICPNEVEARALGVDGDDAEAIAGRLANGGRTAVVTLGARGAAWSRDGAIGTVAPPRITAVDATGAGDSFCAALALALVEGQPIETAIRFACAAGAHAATVRGAEPGLPNRRQVEALLAQ